MTINFLQAFNGDAIHIQFENKTQSLNILIDGGTSTTYTFKNKKVKLEDGDLKKLIKNIRDKNEKLDLVVLTHIDTCKVATLLYLKSLFYLKYSLLLFVRLYLLFEFLYFLLFI